MHTKPQKRRLRTFLAVKEIAMLSLVALSFILLALEHLKRLSHEQLLAIELYEISVAFIFIAEFVFEWYWAKDRSHYVKYHWFYLLAAVPIPVQSFELLRGIRALRLLKLLQIFAHLKYEHNTRLFARK